MERLLKVFLQGLEVVDEVLVEMVAQLEEPEAANDTMGGHSLV